MEMRDRIIETLSHEPEEDWRGGLNGGSWYEDMLFNAIVPSPEGYSRLHGPGEELTEADREYERLAADFNETLETLIHERTVGRSWVFNARSDPAASDEYCVGRDYFVWLKTPEKAEWTEQIEAADRATAEMHRSGNPQYGKTFVFGHDDEVMGLTECQEKPLRIFVLTRSASRPTLVEGA